MKYFLVPLFSLVSFAVFSSSGNGNTDRPQISDRSNPLVPGSEAGDTLQSFASGNGNKKGDSFLDSSGESGGEGVPFPTDMTWTVKGILVGTAVGAVSAVTTPDAGLTEMGLITTSGAVVLGLAGHVADMCGYYFREHKRKKLYPELFKK